MDSPKTCQQQTPDCSKCQHDKCTCPWKQQKEREYEQANHYWEEKRMSNAY